MLNFLNRLAATLVIVILMLFGWGWVRPRLIGLPSVSQVISLPTSDAALLAAKPLMFGCNVSLNIGPVLEATCTDCLWFPISQLQALPSTYAPAVVPTQLTGGGSVQLMLKAPLQNLFAAAKAAGYDATVTSAYRSYKQQKEVFDGWIAYEMEHNTLEAGTALKKVLQYSALPGHSEHQLGTAVDINCKGCRAFDDNDPRNLALWQFLADHAHEYGFVLSYPRDIEALTGYQYEPWHFRYVGVKLATLLYHTKYQERSGTCLYGLLSRLSTPIP